MTQKVYGMTDVIHEVKRMADAMEEILRLVKVDQAKTAERYKEYDKEEPKPDLPDDVPFAGRL